MTRMDVDSSAVVSAARTALDEIGREVLWLDRELRTLEPGMEDKELHAETRALIDKLIGTCLHDVRTEMQELAEVLVGDDEARGSSGSITRKAGWIIDWLVDDIRELAVLIEKLKQRPDTATLAMMLMAAGAPMMQSYARLRVALEPLRGE